MRLDSHRTSLNPRTRKLPSYLLHPPQILLNLHRHRLVRILLNFSNIMMIIIIIITVIAAAPILESSRRLTKNNMKVKGGGGWRVGVGGTEQHTQTMQYLSKNIVIYFIYRRADPAVALSFTPHPSPHPTPHTSKSNKNELTSFFEVFRVD